MFRNTFLKAALFTACSSLFASASHAGMYITEWMYQGVDGEFVEFTNTGNTPIDMTGWSFDDDSRSPGVLNLASFGIVQPGQSVVITEIDANVFRSNWSLPASVKVIGGYTNNLGRNDEINLFDNTNALVDRLTYGDQNFPGSFRSQTISANIPLASLGSNDVFSAVASSLGDPYNSYTSTPGNIANPGQYAPIPEPASLALLAAGSLLVLTRRKHQH